MSKLTALKLVNAVLDDPKGKVDSKDKEFLLQAAKVHAILALVEAVEQLAHSNNRPGSMPPRSPIGVR